MSPKWIDQSVCQPKFVNLLSTTTSTPFDVTIHLVNRISVNSACVMILANRISVKPGSNQILQSRLKIEPELLRCKSTSSPSNCFAI